MVRRAWVGFVLVAALVPFGAEPALACAPRTFGSIQPPAATGDTAGSQTPDSQQPPGPTVAEDAASPAADAAPAPEIPLASWTPPPPECSYVYRMGFPVVGGGEPGWSLFGEHREGGLRLHAGVDILAPKMTPVVAVKAGTVSAVRDTPGDCCWVAVRHDDGWTSMYVHLNNDTIGTNDGGGVGIRPGLREGDRVDQGELIGWIGDSGNAEGGPSHVHFELRTPWGEPVDPGPSLYAARRKAHPTLVENALDLRFGGAFVDYHLTTTARVFDTASALGLPAWCDDLAVRACPRDEATRDAVAGWMSALAGQPVMPTLTMPTLGFDLTNDSCLVSGCPEPMTRGEIARLILSVRYSDVPVDTPEAAIGFLHARGEIDSCDPNGLDPTARVDRSGALQMLLRAWGYLVAPPCDRLR